jgi:hypothetical protein
MSAAPIVLRRSWAARGAGGRDVCSSCGQNVTVGEPCPDCRELAAPAGLVGRLEVLAEIAGRRQVVLLERSPEGGWEPLEVRRRELAAS